MKLKVKIIGPKVHDVGYRYFLMSNAIDLGLKGFHARNRLSGETQEVIALVEGDEETIAEFGKLVETKKPEHSEVSNIAFEDYGGDVMKAGEYAQVCSALQLNKAIPLLIDIRDDIKAVRKNTDIIPEMRDDIKAVRKNTDIIPEMRDDIKAVRKNTDIIPEMRDDIKAVRRTSDMTLTEIKGLREDIQPGFAMQIQQIQADVRAIKERLGMT
ncbi:MAG: acylphosphatase [Methanothrix sp.]|nr:acylphosphatase [Methanothrix sp.]